MVRRALLLSLTLWLVRCLNDASYSIGRFPAFMPFTSVAPMSQGRVISFPRRSAALGGPLWLRHRPQDPQGLPSPPQSHKSVFGGRRTVPHCFVALILALHCF